LGTFANFAKPIPTLEALRHEVDLLEGLDIGQGRAPRDRSDAARRRSADVANSSRTLNFWVVSDYIRTLSSLSGLDAAYQTNLETSRGRLPWSVSLRFEVSLHPERNRFSPPFLSSMSIRSSEPKGRAKKQRLPQTDIYKTLFIDANKLRFHGRWSEEPVDLLGTFSRAIWTHRGAVTEVRRLGRLRRNLVAGRWSTR
jgi:hypothetical protein